MPMVARTAFCKYPRRRIARASLSRFPIVIFHIHITPRIKLYHAKYTQGTRSWVLRVCGYVDH
jgi:hypothetical protein